MSRGFDKHASGDGNPDLYILNQNLIVEPKSFRIANLGEVGTLRVSGLLASAATDVVLTTHAAGNVTKTTVTSQALSNAVNGTNNAYIQNQNATLQTANFRITGNAENSGNYIMATTVGKTLWVGTITPILPNYKSEIIGDTTNVNGLLLRGGSSTLGNALLLQNLAGTNIIQALNAGRTLFGNAVDDGSSVVRVNGVIRALQFNAAEVGNAGVLVTNFGRIVVSPGNEGTFGIDTFNGSDFNRNLFLRTGENNSVVIANLGCGLVIGQPNNFVPTNTIKLDVYGNGTSTDGIRVTGGSSTVGNNVLFRNLALTNLFQVLNANRTLIGGGTDNTLDRLQVNGSVSLTHVLNKTVLSVAAAFTFTDEEVVILNAATTTSVVFPTGRDGRKIIVHNRTGNILVTTSYISSANIPSTTQINNRIVCYRYFGALWYEETNS